MTQVGFTDELKQEAIRITVMNDDVAKKIRERADRNAIASSLLASRPVPADLQSKLEAYVEGKRNLEQLLKSALASHTRKN